ncbi:MAG: T9SS type A sorting domain-containing protein [Ignavibacteria bacterium]|nr:T9SS type A sorting domain-containing protein [Ignavibacteria bacterium]
MKNILFKIILLYAFLSLTDIIIILAQDEPDEIHEMRNKWFERDRTYPYDTLQQYALINGLSQRNQLTQSQGYSIGASIWTNIGPVSYEQNSKRYSGRVSVIKYNPLNPSTVFIGGACGGVWKTFNSQSTPSSVVFNPLTDELLSLSSGDIVIDPNDTNTIYYGTGQGMYFFAYTYYGRGVYKSTDGGANWSGPFTSGLPMLTTIFRMAVNPANSSEIYMAEKRGLFKSTDEGESWTRIIPEPGKPSRQCNDVVISDNGTKIYAVGPSEQWTWGSIGDEYRGMEYWVSTNSGTSFTKVSGTGFHPSSRTHIVVAPNDNGKVYAVTANRSNGDIYAYRSTDAGLSFIDSTDLGDNSGMLATFLFIQVSPANSSNIIIGWGNGTTWDPCLYKSTNAGATYTSVDVPYADMGCAAFHPTDANQLILGCDGGLFISTDFGVSWPSLNNSLGLSLIYRITSNPNDAENVFVGVQDNGFLQKDRNSTLWYSRQSGWDGTNVIWSEISNDILIGSTGTSPNPWGSNIWPSGNKGQNFSNVFVEGIWDGGNDWIAIIEPDPDIPNYYYTARRSTNYGNIMTSKSTNNGSYWSTNSGINPISIPDSGAPYTYTICEKNHDIFYLSTKNGYFGSNLYRTTNGGSNWFNMNIYSSGVAQREVTNITTDPGNENEVYLTVSGFGSGHVFKSTNKGANWLDISGSPPPGGSGLPDLPVNDFIIRYTSCTNKEVIVATDAGVYKSILGSGTWQEVADNLPNSIAMDLDLNLISGKLRTATFGRGAWEIGLSGAVFVKDTLVLRDDQSLTSGLLVNEDIVVCSGAVLKLPLASTIKMKSDAKITIMSGGTIDASSGNAITFTSQSGTWGGIEFQGTGAGTLKNCTFQNTTTPIVIESDGGQSTEHPELTIDNCTFTNASVQITNRPEVTIQNCSFTYTSGDAPTVLGVLSTGSDNVDIYNNTVTSNSSITSTGISVVYGNNVSVRDNAIENMGLGISLSNSDAFVENNTITATGDPGDNIGIGADNSYSCIINKNTVTDYFYGIKLYSSSPTMLENTVETGITDAHCLYFEEASSPRLRPDFGGEEIIWDAGQNVIRNTAYDALYAYQESIPDMDYGCNTFAADRLYFDADFSWPTTIPPTYYYIRGNTWEEPFSTSKFHISAEFIYTPTGCDQQRGGGGYPELPMLKEDPGSTEPPQPLIVNHGNGIYDTLNTSTTSQTLPSDQSLFMQGMKQELMGNFSSAIEIYKNVISEYRDSLSAISSMKRLVKCNDRMGSDSTAYSQLRSYFLNLASNNQNDTAFVYIARELSTKCLVRQSKYADATTEYENSISGYTDSLHILNAELNIIETYMIMNTQHGDAMGFTGKLANLKPMNPMDGYKKLKEKLYRLKDVHTSNTVPEKFSLSQNYPNPFNPVTKINFTLPNDSKVSIKIYDILGRTVRVLIDEFRKKGTHIVTFDGTGLASGVYFYSIEARQAGSTAVTFKDTKKMVLVK